MKHGRILLLGLLALTALAALLILAPWAVGLRRTDSRRHILHGLLTPSMLHVRGTAIQ